MATKKHSSKIGAAQIDTNTRRHGKAAALALFVEMEKTDGRTYGEPGRLERTRKMLAAYLAGYATASAQARRGFLMYVGEFMEMIYGPGQPNLEKWQEPRRVQGPALRAVEYRAHSKKS